MKSKHFLSGSFVLAILLSSSAAFAQVAADICPPFGFLNATNHALNPSFEKAYGGHAKFHSAAAQWLLHTNNFGAPISSALVTTTAPHGTDPGEQLKMIHVAAGSNEGGIYQILPTGFEHAKMMFSVWVNVKKGHVAMQLGSFVGSPAGFSTKHNQWEELRVCSNGNTSAPNQDAIFVVNEDPDGGQFDVDRVEVREIQ